MFEVESTGSTFGFEGVSNSQGRVVLGVPAGVQIPTGSFVVTAYIFDAQNFEVDRDVLEVDTASLAVATDVEGAPLGVVATVTDAAGQPWEGRTVQWSVLRNGVELYDGEGLTASDGTVAVQGEDGKIPGGPLTIQLDLVGLGGDVADSDSRRRLRRRLGAPGPTRRSSRRCLGKKYVRGGDQGHRHR